MVAVICHDRLYSNMRLFLGPAGGIGFSQLPLATYRLAIEAPRLPRVFLSVFSEKQPFEEPRRRAGDGETREPGARSAAKLALDSHFTD
jgi:hypothetical protein